METIWLRSACALILSRTGRKRLENSFSEPSASLLLIGKIWAIISKTQIIHKRWKSERELKNSKPSRILKLCGAKKYRKIQTINISILAKSLAKYSFLVFDIALSRCFRGFEPRKDVRQYIPPSRDRLPRTPLRNRTKSCRSNAARDWEPNKRAGRRLQCSRSC